MDNWVAILTTSHGCLTPGARMLIAMPTATTNPHAVGRIVSAVPHGEFNTRRGMLLPRFLLTIAVEHDDDQAAKWEFAGSLAIDCYRTREEAEKWHAVDDEHVDKNGYGRNHWL